MMRDPSEGDTFDVLVHQLQEDLAREKRWLRNWLLAITAMVIFCGAMVIVTIR